MVPKYADIKTEWTSSVPSSPAPVAKASVCPCSVSSLPPYKIYIILHGGLHSPVHTFQSKMVFRSQCFANKSPFSWCGLKFLFLCIKMCWLHENIFCMNGPAYWIIQMSQKTVLPSSIFTTLPVSAKVSVRNELRIISRYLQNFPYCSVCG